MYHAGREAYTFLFVTRFCTPPLPAAGTAAGAARYALSFLGVNYRVRAWLNGAELDVGARCEGMFLPKRADATAALASASGAGVNTLVCCVAPPDHVGCVDGGGQGGDHGLARDVAAQCTQGWDWTAPVADRNTGFWRAVALEATGPLALRDVHVIPAVTLGAPPAARVTVRATVANLQTEAECDALLTLQLTPPGGGAGHFHGGGPPPVAPAGAHGEPGGAPGKFSGLSAQHSDGRDD